MPIMLPALDELFTVRVTSYHKLNPSQRWSNNYCLEAGTGADYVTLEGFAIACLEFQTIMSYDSIVTERAVVSTYIRDSNPYDGNEFMTVEHNQDGSIAGSDSSLLPLEACLYLRKKTQTGRNGKLFLRGVLQETDVQFGQSLFVLSAGNTIQSRLSTAIATSGLNTYMTQAAEFTALVIPPTSTQALGARNVDSLDIGGVRFVNMNKRYYDR